MKQITMYPGASANGDSGQGVLLGGGTYTCTDGTADDLVNRRLAFYTTGGVGGAPSPQFAQTPIPNGGFSIGVLGASTVARNFVQYKCNQGNYTRSNGIATAVLNKPTAEQAAGLAWLPGRAIRFGSQDNPETEGQFAVATYSDLDASTARVTWVDKRPDFAASSMLNDSEVLDLHAYSAQSAWVQLMNIALGGKCEFTIVGTGSTNLDQWDVSRLQQLLANAPYDAIIVDGLIGNTLLGIMNGQAGKVLTFDQVKARMAWLIETLLPYCRVLMIPTPPGNRNVPVSSAAYTTGALLVRWLYTEAIGKYRNLVVAPQGELLASNWQDPTQPLNSDVAANLPPAQWLYSDGTHYSWPASVRVGTACAYALQRFLAYFTPEGGAMPQSRLENSVAEIGGRYNSVALSGRWGQRSVKGSPDAGTSGTQPNSTTLSGTNIPAGATIVQSVLPGLDGGIDWITTIADASGHAAGSKFTWNDQTSNGALLSILNDSANKGKRIRFTLPLGVTWTNEYACFGFDLSLYATAGGVEYMLGSFGSAKGLYGLGGGSKKQIQYGNVVAGGTGYVVGDVLAVSGGTQTVQAKLLVTGTSGGAVTRFMVAEPGTYTVTPSNNVSVTGGSGSGATFALTWMTAAWALDWGASGNWTLPREVTLPNGMTWTAASLRLVLNGTPGVGYGTLRVRWGAGQLLEVIG